LSQTVWRIATDTPAFDADDLSGAGAKATGGRWNAAGVAAVYTSQTRALACLETVVHLNAGGLPLNRYLVEVRIPDKVWANAQTTNSASLPVGWDADGAVSNLYRVGVCPTIVLAYPGGIVHDTAIRAGNYDADEISGLVDDLLAATRRREAEVR